MSRFLARPRYADVVGTLALLVAMSGTAYAAHALPKNSVGSKQIKDNKVAAKDVKDGAIGAADLAAGSVGSAHLQPGSVGTANLAPGAVTAAQLAGSSVGSTAVANGAIGSAAVANDSLTLGDIVGADHSSNVTFSLSPSTCTSLVLTAPGAQPGQVGLLSLTGNVAIPNVMFTPARVEVVDQVTMRVCNVSLSTANVTGLGVRVITLG
jgi:hypothetical protein